MLRWSPVVDFHYGAVFAILGLKVICGKCRKSQFFLYNAYFPWKQFTITIKKCWHYVELCFWSNNFFFLKISGKGYWYMPLPSGSTKNVFLKFVHQNLKRKYRNYKWSLIIEIYSIWRYFLESFIKILREIMRCMKSKFYHTNLEVGKKLIYFNKRA